MKTSLRCVYLMFWECKTAMRSVIRWRIHCTWSLWTWLERLTQIDLTISDYHSSITWQYITQSWHSASITTGGGTGTQWLPISTRHYLKNMAGSGEFVAIFATLNYTSQSETQSGHLSYKHLWCTIPWHHAWPIIAHLVLSGGRQVAIHCRVV